MSPVCGHGWDEMTVASLWIEFERHLIKHVTIQISISSLTAPVFVAQLTARIEHQIEYSRIDDLVDLYKDWIDSETLGRVKQIKGHRDWISHRNPSRRKPAIIDPGTARVIRGSVMDQLA